MRSPADTVVEVLHCVVLMRRVPLVCFFNSVWLCAQIPMVASRRLSSSFSSPVSAAPSTPPLRVAPTLPFQLNIAFFSNSSTLLFGSETCVLIGRRASFDTTHDSQYQHLTRGEKTRVGSGTTQLKRQLSLRAEGDDSNGFRDKTAQLELEKGPSERPCHSWTGSPAPRHRAR